jgi:hypothetical protein
MGSPYLIAYIELYKNNKLVETIATQSYYAGNNSIDSSGAITTDMIGNFGNGDLMYFIYEENNLYDIVLGEYSSKGWHIASNNLQHMYTNTLYPDIQSNIIVISKESINKSKNIDFSIYLDGSEISRTNAIVIDINDPIIGFDAPENPNYGQLWLDTSTTPYRLMIFTQIEETDAGEWVYFSQQNGQNIYTSKPTQYSVGDLWILADGEFYPEDNPIYMAGSMLRADENLNWVDTMDENTQFINNVKQYFAFDAGTGLKIGQKDEKFYVNISSTEMGFYDNSDINNPDQKVVSIGNKSATIKNMVVNESADFNCSATFNKEIEIREDTMGFIWKIESNGSFSLAIST